MKKLERVAAFLMAAVVAVYGLPFTPAHAQDQDEADRLENGWSVESAEVPAEAEVQTEEEPAAADSSRPAMRFVQHKSTGPDDPLGDGFDRSTGILTMDLEILTSDAKKMVDGTQDLTQKYPGKYVAGGYLAFQVDGTSIVPLLADGTYLTSFSGAGKTASYAGDASNPGLSTFLGSGGAGERLTSLDAGNNETNVTFAQCLGVEGGIFNEQHSGIIVSTKRCNERHKYVYDCYLEFELDSKKFLTPQEDGEYVKVLSLPFLCYSGSSGGVLTPATDPKALFSRSIRLPKIVEGSDHTLDTSEAQELVAQFQETPGSSTSMALGVAGFWEKQYVYNNILDMEVPQNTAYYYYYNEPQDTPWYTYVNGITPNTWAGKTTTSLTAAATDIPELEYYNDDAKYIVTGFGMDLTNTFYDADTDTEAVTNPDFNIPSNESGEWPRYQVPTTKDMEDIQANEATYGSWVSKSHDEVQSKQVPLKYELYTETSNSSETNPELDGARDESGNLVGPKENPAPGEEGQLFTPEQGGRIPSLDAFLHSINWHFLLGDGTRLDDHGYSKINGTDGTITTQSATYTYFEATIKDRDPNYSYNGLRVWVVQNDGNITIQNEKAWTEMVTPIGVTLDFQEKGDVTYLDRDSSDRITRKSYKGWVPQLRITTEALNKNSFLWSTKDEHQQHNGVLYLQAEYVADSGGVFRAKRMEIDLYRTSSKVTDINMKTSETLKVTNPEGVEVDGFSVPVGGDPTNDKFITSGYRLSFQLKDQYGSLILDKDGYPVSLSESGVTIEPDEATKAKLKSGEIYDNEKDNPFTITKEDLQLDSNTGWYHFTLSYTPGKTVNDVIAGNYIIRAHYVDPATASNVSWEKTLYVHKEEDEFAYLASSPSGDHLKKESMGADQVLPLIADVPEKADSTAPWSVSLTLTELANQWRDPSVTVINKAAYDFKPDLRDDSGNFVLEKVINQFDVRFRYTCKDSKGSALERIPGVDVSSFLEAGVLSYDASVPNGAVMDITVEVHYKNDPADKILTNKYRITFQRSASRLSKILVQNDATEVQVPTEREENASGANKLSIICVPEDQYGVSGKDYTWEKNVYPSYSGQVNPNYWVVKTEPDLAANPLEGITVSSEDPLNPHMETFTVTHEAEPIKVEYWIEYGTFTSRDPANPTYIDIHRADSIPTTIKNFSYSPSTLIVPNLEQSLDPTQSTATSTPSFELYDQFGEKMTLKTEDNPDGNYTLRWFWVENKGPAEPDKVSLDTDTGAVTVKALAKPDAKFVLGFNIYYTVKNADGAPSSKFEQIILSQNNEYGITPLQIQRQPASPTDLKVNESSLKFPTVEEIQKGGPNASPQLTAAVSTQYGEGQESQAKDLTWTLDEVWLKGSTEPEPISDSKVNGVTTYSSGCINLTANGESSGQIMYQMNNVQNRNAIVDHIFVTCNYGGSLEATETRHRIDFTVEGPVAAEVELPSNMGTAIDVPDVGQADNTMTLSGVIVRDQYNCVMTDAQIKWLIKDATKTWTDSDNQLTGVTLEDGNVIHVDPTAGRGQLTVRALYDSNVKPVYADTEVVIQWDVGDPMSVAITKIKVGKDAVKTEMSAPLPSQSVTESGTAYPETTLYLSCEITDNHGNLMGGRIVSWEVISGDSYNLVKSGKNTNGQIVVAYNDAVKQAMEQAQQNGTPFNDPQLTVKATVMDKDNVSQPALYNGNPVEITTVVTLKKQDPKPAYAEPILGAFTPSTDPAKADEYVLIPPKGQQNSEANFTAQVYDQYGLKITSGEDAKANLTLTDPQQGLIFPANAVDSAKLEIQSFTSAFRATVQATPVNNPTGLSKTSTKTVYFDRGVGYLYGLALGTTSQLNDNPTRCGVDRWPVTDENVVKVNPASENAITFHALPVDQYDKEFPASSLWVPRWEFKEEYPGVSFKAGQNTLDRQDENGNTITSVLGKDMTIVVTGEALGEAEKEKTITINCYMYNTRTSEVKNTDEYIKQQQFTIRKEDPVASYLFFNDVDEDGNYTGAALQRPTLAEKSLSTTFSTVVYDQYGFERTDAVLYGITRQSVSDAGATLEPVYETIPPAEGAGNQTPTQGALLYYQVTQPNGKPAVRIEPTTGKLTVLTSCELSELTLYARMAQTGSSVKYKTMNVSFTEAARVPSSMEISKRPPDTVKLEDTSEMAQPTSVMVTIAVYDQFGDIFLGGDAYPKWSWTMKTGQGEEATYEEYTEEDDKGQPKDPSDYMVSFRETGVRSLILSIDPQKYAKNLTLRIQCQLLDGSAAGAPLAIDPKSVEVEIERVVTAGGPAQPVAYLVTYNAGEHGKLAGDVTQEMVEPGGSPKHTPGVKVDPGYGIKGWSTPEGLFVKNLSEAIILQDTVFTAQYMSVAEKAFLNGYDDNTVRPTRAVTRGEFTKMLVMATGLMDEDGIYSHPFDDVDSTRYYDKYIGCAFTMGIVHGDGGKIFRPNDPITRAEAAKMVAEAAGLGESAEKPEFSDTNPYAWYAGYVQSLVKAGVVNGYSDGTYKPRGTLARNESVKMLVLIMEDSPSQAELERIRKYGASKFTDISSTNWAYPYILRASGAA